jgi:NAD-dependent histone deacetylase SIR2
VALLGADHSNGETIAEIIQKDLAAGPDLLLVLGTSLRLSGPKKIACMFAREVRKKRGIVVYTNLSQPSHSWGRLVDYVIEDSCDTWVKDLETRSIKRIMASSLIREEGENRDRGSRHHGRGHKNSIRIENARGKTKEDGSAEHPFIVD